MSTPDPDRINTTADAEQRVIYNRDGQRWILRYGPGEEAALLRALVALSQRSDAPLDAIDCQIIAQVLRRPDSCGRGPTVYPSAESAG